MTPDQLRELSDKVTAVVDILRTTATTADEWVAIRQLADAARFLWSAAIYLERGNKKRFWVCSKCGRDYEVFSEFVWHIMTFHDRDENEYLESR